MQYSLNVRLAVIRDRLTGHVFQDLLPSAKFFDFLKHHLPGLLDGIPVPQKAEIIYQHDGSCTFSQCCSGFSGFCSIHDGFFVRGQIHWIPKPPGLISSDFFVWGFLKQEIYRTEVASLQDLSSQLDAAIIKMSNKLFLKVTVISICK